jgi:transposase/AcrR family transcriptional regulator
MTHRQALSAETAPRNDQRNRILDAARKAVAAHGLAGLDADEVGRTAGVPASAVVRHFPTRRCLFETAATAPLDTYAQHVARVGRKLADADRTERFELCYDLHRELFQVMQQTAPLLTAALAHGGDAGHALYRDCLRTTLDALRAAIEVAASGWSYQDGDAEIISVMSLGTYLWLALLGEFGEQTADTDQMARRFLAFVMRAHEVAPPPADLPAETVPPEPDQIITDEVWAVLSPHLPAATGRGQRWRDHHLMLEAVAWKCSTDLPWRCLPTRFGPWQTVWKRAQRWQADGTWSRLVDAVAQAPDTVRAQCEWMCALVVPGPSGALTASFRKTIPVPDSPGRQLLSP